MADDGDTASVLSDLNTVEVDALTELPRHSAGPSSTPRVSFTTAFYGTPRTVVELEDDATSEAPSLALHSRHKRISSIPPFSNPKSKANCQSSEPTEKVLSERQREKLPEELEELEEESAESVAKVTNGRKKKALPDPGLPLKQSRLSFNNSVGQPVARRYEHVSCSLIF